LLAERSPEDPVAVINGGIRGKSLDYFSKHIDFLLDETQPQVLILNINDRLRFEVDELQRLDSGGVLSLLHGLEEYSVLARVILLAIEGPPDHTGMPESWWEESGGGSEDRLTAEIRTLESSLDAQPDNLGLRVTLAETYARRSDYSRSIQTYDQLIELQPEEPAHRLRRAEYRLMARNFEGAWADLQRISQDFSAFHDVHWSSAQELRADQSWVHTNKKMALYYATWGKPEMGITMVDEVQRLRPGTAWSHDYLDFLEAVVESQSSGAGLDSHAPTAEILFERMAGSDVEDVARYGLFERNGQQVSRTEEETAAAFELLLREHLERVQDATQERGTALIVENMSSRPEQSRIIAEVCSDLGIPLVQLQEGLAEHPQRADLLHPTQSLRMSVEGNAFMAEELLPAVEAALAGAD